MSSDVLKRGPLLACRQVPIRCIVKALLPRQCLARPHHLLHTCSKKCTRLSCSRAYLSGIPYVLRGDRAGVGSLARAAANCSILPSPAARLCRWKGRRSEGGRGESTVSQGHLRIFCLQSACHLARRCCIPGFTDRLRPSYPCDTYPGFDETQQIAKSFLLNRLQARPRAR